MRNQDPFLFALLALYLVLATTYSVVNPLFESPDEIWHYEYVRWLVEGHGLPEPEDVGHAPWHQEGSQPPLYYLTAAALTSWIPTDNAQFVIRYNPHADIGQADSFGNKNVMVHGSAEDWPWSDVALAAHLARFLSIFLGCITVAATVGAVRQIFPERKASALLAGAIVGLNPQFLFLSGAINNDNLVTCFSAVGIWYGLRLVRQSIHQGHNLTDLQVVCFGLIAGGAALSKLSGLLVSGFVGLTLTFIAMHRRSWALWIRWGLIGGSVMVLVSGWWFVRNWLLFGDPLALTAMFAILPRRAEPPTWTELQARAEGVWNSFWAVFGWFNVVAPRWVYGFYSGLTIVGLLGFLINGWGVSAMQNRGTQILGGDNRESNKDTAQNSAKRIQVGLLLIWIGLLLFSLLSWAQMRYPQGRLLFPALSAIGVVLGIGLLNWIPKRWQVGSTVGILCVMVAVAVAAPFLWIRPAYQPALATDEFTEALGNPTHLPDEGIWFGDGIQLIDAHLSAAELKPGDDLSVLLEWKSQQAVANDYSVFIHLIDENEILQTQSDSYPGQGNAPISQWMPNQVVQDLHQVTIPETVPSPVRLKVNVGLYRYATGERLLINGSDHWTLGYISLIPPAGDGSLPHSALINFGDKIALVGYDFDRYVMAPGETLTLKLWFEALDAPLRDYKIFTHLILPPDATWAQRDSRPQNGFNKTNTWQLGDRVEDEYQLVLPEDAPEGVYFVEVGIYDGETYERLQVNFSPKGIVLGQVRVRR